jgi:hypothetical protein
VEVQPYRPHQADAWNAFNRDAENGHFLFDRGFMDYHADRFEDGSLMVSEAGRLIALLPANRIGDAVWSHQGLTFGGLIAGPIGAARTHEALDACIGHLAAAGVRTLVYKALPWIYARAPVQADLHWLFLKGAVLTRRDLSTAIDYRARGPVSDRRRRGARKTETLGLTLQSSSDWAGFWTVLEQVLAERHGVRPTHSLAEIERLAARFPREITLHTATLDGTIAAGVVMFCGAQVAHAQYIAASDEGRKLGALDGLFEHLIQAHASSHRFFDFGVSTTDQGRVLNEGLVRQKEEFGGGAVVHDVYRLDLSRSGTMKSASS